jgi:hypothetical protein
LREPRAQAARRPHASGWQAGPRPTANPANKEPSGKAGPRRRIRQSGPRDATGLPEGAPLAASMQIRGGHEGQRRPQAPQRCRTTLRRARFQRQAPAAPRTVLSALPTAGGVGEGAPPPPPTTSAAAAASGAASQVSDAVALLTEESFATSTGIVGAVHHNEAEVCGNMCDLRKQLWAQQRTAPRHASAASRCQHGLWMTRDSRVTR